MRIAYDIQWDTDGDENLAESLPKRIEIPDEIPDESIADYISDETGFCHFGFQVRGEAADRRLEPFDLKISYDGESVTVQYGDGAKLVTALADQSAARDEILDLIRTVLDEKLRYPDPPDEDPEE